MRENPPISKARSLVDSIKSRRRHQATERRLQGLDVLNKQDEDRQKKSTDFAE